MKGVTLDDTSKISVKLSGVTTSVSPKPGASPAQARRKSGVLF